MATAKIAARTGTQFASTMAAHRSLRLQPVRTPPLRPQRRPTAPGKRRVRRPRPPSARVVTASLLRVLESGEPEYNGASSASPNPS